MQKNRKLRKNSNTKQMLKKGIASLLMLSMIMGSIPVCASESITEQSTEIQTEKEKSVQVQNQLETEKADETQQEETAGQKEEDPEPETDTEKNAESAVQTESNTGTEQMTEKEEPESNPGTESETSVESESSASLEENTENETETEAETETEQIKVQSLENDAEKLEAGTYSITANLSMPGEYNPVVPGLTVYANNPNNPFGPTVDENDPAEVSSDLPSAPLSGNATLIVSKTGVKYLVLPVKNPIFTLQQIGTCSKLSEISVERTTPTSGKGTGQYEGTYGSYSSRIHKILVKLTDTQTKGRSSYHFQGSVLYAVPLDKELSPSGSIALTLDVNYDTVKKKSASTTVPSLKDLVNGSGSGEPENPDVTAEIEMLEGNGNSWTGEGTLLFRSAADCAEFEAVAVDGTVIDSSSYDAFSGSTYVELKESYLETLSEGTHKLEIRSVSGTAYASFTVTKNAKQPDEDEKMQPGTYTITANLSMPGKYNPVISGITVYANNPNNPFGPTLDENDASEVTGDIPSAPLADNATLVVTEKGEKYLYLPIKNPIFTTQNLGTCKELKEIQEERVTPTKGKGAGQYEGTYGSRKDRIHKIRVKLSDSQVSGKKTYYFKGSVLYAVPLDQELAPEGDVALSLELDYSSVKKVSDSTKVTALKGNEQNNSTRETETEEQTETETESEKKNQKDTDPNAGDGTLKPGTYTVAANIWIDKASSGLPLNPHLTSSAFPPKDPVSNNAKVTMDKKGKATVEVPIVIPSKVMSVKSISGLDIVDSSSSGGYLTSITVDLGKVTNPNAVITKSCTVSLDLGELAQTIAKKGKEQTWGATFQVNFSGIPSGTSGGGNVDVNALLSQGETKDAAKQGTNIRFGIRADAYSAPYVPMMEEHKNDTEIKETVANTNAGTDAASTGNSGVSTEVKNSYLFTVEKLEDTEENKDLTEEEQSNALSKQYLQHFTDGSYDLVLATPEEAETLCEDTAVQGKFVVLTMLEYRKRDAEVQEETAVGEDAAQEESETQEVRLLLATTAFVKNHGQAVTDLLENTEASVAEANASPEQTAVSMVALGMESKTAEASVLLKENEAVLLTGGELQSAVKALAEEKSLSDLNMEGLCYIPTEKAADTEVPATSETEKIAITDADSLSAALDAALEKKAETAGEKETSDTDQTSGTVTVSNSSGLDLEAEETAGEALQPGTYTVSANLYLPGERNLQLPGTTAYMTNPDNPLGIGGHEGIPMTPAEGNATLVVKEDGSKIVLVDLVNPVFTLQKIDAPQNSQILDAVRDNERYEGTNGVGVDGRIIQLAVQLGDDSALYPFDDCAEFPTLLEADWYVPLELSVEFRTAEKISDRTDISLP